MFICQALPKHIPFLVVFVGIFFQQVKSFLLIIWERNKYLKQQER